MGLTPFDVQNLNRSMEGLGDTFRQNRLDKRKEEEDMRREMLQQQMANASEERQKRGLSIEEQRLQEEKNRGQREQQQGELQDKQRFLQTLMQLNATGQLADLDSVNEFLASDPYFSQVGIQLKEPPKKPEANVGQSAVARALREADYWKSKGNTDYATKLEKWADLQGAPKPEANNFVETETKPAIDPMGKPIPGQTVTTTKRRTPAGSPAAVAPAPAGGKVRMLNPSGVPGMVPAEQVDAATKQGYKLAPQ